MDGGFIGTSGVHFTFDGRPFYFAGANTYYLIYKSRYMVDAVFDSAQAIGLQVIRTWAFLDIGSLDGTVPDTDAPKEGTYFHYWDPGNAAPTYNDGANGLERLDYVVYAASLRGIKLILPLVNNWKEFGGMDQYLTWYGLSHHDDFYTDLNAKQRYKDWISHMLNRTNIYTGKQYREETAIMAWELANEPRCRGSNSDKPRSPNCAAATLLSWVQEMSSFVKQSDSNHLVAVGDEGFFNRQGNNDWLYNGSEGADFEAFLQSPAIDFGTFHLYPDSWGKAAGWGAGWIREHLDAGSIIGKPVILEEFGWRDQATRAAEYQTWLHEVYNDDGGGDLIWMLAAERDDNTLYPDYDGFTIYKNTPIAALISAHVAQMAAKA